MAKTNPWSSLEPTKGGNYILTLKVYDKEYLSCRNLLLRLVGKNLQEGRIIFSTSQILYAPNCTLCCITYNLTLRLLVWYWLESYSLPFYAGQEGGGIKVLSWIRVIFSNLYEGSRPKKWWSWLACEAHGTMGVKNEVRQWNKRYVSAIPGDLKMGSPSEVSFQMFVDSRKLQRSGFLFLS